MAPGDLQGKEGVQMDTRPTITATPREGVPSQRSPQLEKTPRDSAGGSGGRGLTRITVNLTPRAMDALDSAVSKTSDSRTDSINRALQVYDLFLDLLARGGGSLLLKHADGETERVYIL